MYIRSGMGRAYPKACNRIELRARKAEAKAAIKDWSDEQAKRESVVATKSKRKSKKELLSILKGNPDLCPGLLHYAKFLRYEKEQKSASTQHGPGIRANKRTKARKINDRDEDGHEIDEAMEGDEADGNRREASQLAHCCTEDGRMRLLDQIITGRCFRCSITLPVMDMALVVLYCIILLCMYVDASVATGQLRFASERSSSTQVHCSRFSTCLIPHIILIKRIATGRGLLMSLGSHIWLCVLRLELRSTCGGAVGFELCELLCCRKRCQTSSLVEGNVQASSILRRCFQQRFFDTHSPCRCFYCWLSMPEFFTGRASDGLT